MKVAIFTDTYIPEKNGVATSIKQIKEGFEKNGYEVYIFCPKSKKSLNEKNVYRCSSIQINKKLDAVIAFPNKRKISKIIQSYKPDIIHTHSEFSMGKIGKQIALKHNIPIVHTSHTMWDYYLHYLGIFKYFIKPDKMMRKHYNKIKHFIYPSSKAKERYFQLSNNSSNYKIIPNGVDRKLFIKTLSKEKKDEILKKHNIKQTDKIIIFVGRINKEKNINLLVTHLKDLLMQNNNYKLILIGKGSEEKEIKNFSIKHGLEKQILLIGTIPWEEIYYYYKISDIFASLSKSEVYPMTVIEALTAGIPAILINDYIYKDVIKEGINGFLIKKYENLSRYIEKVIKDDEILKKFKENAKKHSTKFSSYFFTKKIKNYYSEIIARKNH
ncbi:lipid galactosyltransferase [Borreliella burgdorferi]|uniref:lipid galactosyltransferase n=1 Tax=Borreliella burgdorferi TaxID=139 RepID=UPI0004294D69|nr:lipid galactosyltransferase [Borreliella burgdorferi]QXG44160.1 lipid galactosyltransferase [Borreliella burgdorferi]WNY61099.1 lipid galactosyltransferase [Borreliella burgdorferi]WNY61997.1 lipid galactosyltransferase [Borreliella burgdorferi]